MTNIVAGGNETGETMLNQQPREHRISSGRAVLLAAGACILALGCASQPDHGVDLGGMHGPQSPTVASPAPPPTTTPVIPDVVDRMDRARVIYLHGVDILENAHDVDLALLEFGRAIDECPTYERPWLKKGMCYYYKQKYDLEIECYRRCLELAPNYQEAQLNLAQALFAQDKIEEAVRWYLKILDTDAKHPVALFNLGIAYFILEDYDSCIRVLGLYLELHPNDRFRDKALKYIKDARLKRDLEPQPGKTK
jgi:tetratricopeptide (TPR) repeat protein